MLNEGFTTSKDRTIWMLTVLMFSSFFIFEMMTWGKYLFLLFIIAIAIITTQRLPVIERFQKHLLVFAFYCFLTAMWAWIPINALESGLTIVEITVCFSFLYVYYKENENIGLLMSAIKWGGYVVSIYSIIYYGGISAIAAASRESDVRLVNSFSNINEIGMLAAIACVLQVNEFLCNKKITLQAIFLIPAIMIVAASQSRKAFVLLILGLLMIFVLKNIISEEFTIKTIFKIAVLSIVSVALLYLILKTGIFSGTIGRLTENSSSTWGDFFYDPNTLRGQYKLLGWNQFLKNPAGGIGISSSTQMVKEAFGKSTYTHDNYIELLSCGGLLGFIIYYSMYLYLFIKLIKYRICDVKYTDICLTLLLLLLIADTALVSYSSKERYIYLMMFFIESARIDNILENGDA